MAKWRPTPKDLRVTARRLAGDSWEDCPFTDLRPGDVFRAVSSRGDLLNPATLEMDPDAVALVHSSPMKMDTAAGHPRDVGYGVEITLFPSMADLKSGGLS